MLTKTDLRRELKEIRRSIDADKKNTLDERICKNIIESAIFENADIILLYAPLFDEIQTLSIFNAAKSKCKKTAYPKCNKEKHQMDFYFVKRCDDFVNGAYGIKEPITQDLFIHDDNKNVLCIVPCLSCDKFGTRLGYGAGYYDRYFAKEKDILKVALCYESCIKDRLINDKYDVQMDYIATENSITEAKNEQ